MEKKRVWALGSGLLISAAFAWTAAHAANEAMQELLKVLRDKGTIDEQIYRDLLNASKADNEANTAGQAEIKQAAESLPKINTKGKLEWGTSDGDFNFRLGGRIHIDGTFYDNDGGTTLVSGVDARRARLEFQGLLYQHWMFKIDYEFGQTSTVKEGFRDLYVRYIHNGEFPAFLTVGQFKEYLGLEHANSSNDVPFVERALVSRVFHDFAEASDGRRIGVGLNIQGHDLWTGGLGIFGRNVSGDSFDDFTDPFSVQGRVTVSPIHTEKAAIHLGASANWINVNSGGVGAQIASRPEARIGADRLIDTGTIDGLDEVERWGVEAGGIYGPAWFQGEIIGFEADRNSLFEDASFYGWHGEIGWVLTGEPRVYDFSKGTFQNPKPFRNVGQGGWGAWEIAARYSFLDLTDGDIIGGEETNVAAGLNWYINPNFRFMFTYDTVVDVDGGPNDGVNPSFVLFRAHAIW